MTMNLPGQYFQAKNFLVDDSEFVCSFREKRTHSLSYKKFYLLILSLVINHPKELISITVEF